MNSFLNQPGSQPIAWGYADSGCHERGADLFDYALMGLIAFLLLMGRTFLARTFTHEQAVSAVVVSAGEVMMPVGGGVAKR
jgi:hypothetical protein